jgi:hypothetical protein
MAQIKIFSDTNKGCIFFEGSTVEPKFIGTINASVKPDETDRIVIKRLDRFEADGVSFRQLFKRLNPSRVQNQAGQNLVDDLGFSIADVITYINEQANNYQAESTTDLTGEMIGFRLDQTSTSIVLDNGSSFGVNTIKAVVNADGTIHLHAIGSGIPTGSEDADDVVHYSGIEAGNVSINGSIVAGGVQTVANTLNELFTVGAFEAVVITDPFATHVADVGGAVDSGSAVGSNAIDPIGDDILGSSSSHYNKCGWLSDESLDQAGEYFTFDIRVTDSMGFGFVLDQGADVYGAGSYADPAMFCNDSTGNNAAFGYYWSHWFHSGNKGPWTYYGQRASSSIRPGWSGFASSDERVDYIADEPIKMKVGIDANGYMEVAYYDESESVFVPIQRSNYVLEEGQSVKLGIKIYGTRGRLHTVPKKHLLEPAAPTMYFRYIESPDGNFEYPLFATAEEANYYHKVIAGVETGTSHTRTYADDPTNTTWHMPTNGQMAGTAAPHSLVFEGNQATFTEITSYTNADLAPTPFSMADITQEEGTSVNIQVVPAGATWSSSVSIYPTTSGLVYDGYSLIQGTLADVGSDTTYTVTVTRGNSYGSSTGQMTITATDVAPVQTNDTPWTKALDFSGSSERAQQVGSHANYMPIAMDGLGNTVNPHSSQGSFSTVSGLTSDHIYARPWACAVVFKADRHNSNQHIWNQGEGSNGDNIYLRLSATGTLHFGWGRNGATNEFTVATGISSSRWYGVYVGHTGARFSGAQATAGNLAAAFDVRMMDSSDNFTALSENLSTSARWQHVNGARMDRSVYGNMTIGGRGSNRSFHGKVASFVSTTLRCDVAMPDAAEIEEMIKDPLKWRDDTKAGNTFRWASGLTENTFTVGNLYSALATQIWIMGDGGNDSYSNMIRNRVMSADQNYTKLNLLSMVSNDIQTVNINGLT